MTALKKIHYAWIICASSVLIMICNMGLCSNILTVYLPLIEETGISGSQGSAILSIRCLFSFLSIFFVSRFYGKLSFRVGVFVSYIIGALSALIFSFGSGNSAICFIAAALAGICYGLGSTIPMSIAIKNWFIEKRGLALGICSSGTGVCTVIFSPLIADIAQKHSLKAAFLFQMVFMLICGAVTFVLIREKPSDIGLTPLGIDVRKSITENTGLELNIPRSMYILLPLSMFLFGGAGQSFSGHMSVIVTSCNYPLQVAAAVASLFGLTLMISKLLFGSIADSLGTKKTTILFCIIFLLGCAPVTWMNGKDRLPCFLFAILLGMGAPIFNVGLPLWASDFSSSDKYEKTLQRFQLFYSLGGIIFTAIPGFIADRTGEYKSSYLMFAIAVGISLLILVYEYRKIIHKGHFEKL